MWSRRRYLAMLSGGATAALAGCSIGPFGGDGGDDGSLPVPEGRILGRRLLTESAVSMADREAESDPSIGEVLITSPRRVRSTPQLPELGTTYGLPVQFDPSTAELSLSSSDPDVDVVLGTFSADDVTTAPPDDAEARGTHRDASLFVWQNEAAGFGASAVGPGTYVRLGPFETRDLAETGLRTFLDAADGAGTSTLASPPHDEIAPHLDEGFYQYSWFPPIDLDHRSPSTHPGGLSVRADGGLIYRRSVRVYPDKARAERSFLNREAVQRRLREQSYAGVLGSGPAFDSFAVSREGRAIVTAAAIGAEHLDIHVLEPAERLLPSELLEPLPP